MSLFSQALMAFHNGDTDAKLSLIRDDQFAQTFPASGFFDEENFPALEQTALNLCQGTVLDVGAAAGRHSLALQKRGLQVTACEIEPELGHVLLQRGVRNVVVGDIMTWNGDRFDTVLMLMNGIGMVGNEENLDRFLQNLPRLLTDGGSLLCTSKDVDQMRDAIHLEYCTGNQRHGRYPGRQLLAFSYQGAVDSQFEWLHLSPTFFAERCAHAGLHFSLIEQGPRGHYLCRIQLENNRLSFAAME